VGALRSKNVDAFAVPEALAPPVDRPTPLDGITLRPGGLSIALDSSNSTTVPWNALVAGTCTVQGRSASSADRRGGMTLTRYEKTQPEDDGPTATIVLRNSRGDVRAFCFGKLVADYRFLGNRMEMSQAANFALLLREIAGRAPRAYFTESYRAVAGGDMVKANRVMKAMDLADRPELLVHLRWAVCCGARDRKRNKPAV
jgi:hypothetical protein